MTQSNPDENPDRNGRRITRDAHAKVNLVLRVGPPIISGPHTGFHPVCSWMHAIDLCDTLSFEIADTSSLVTTWEDGSEAAWDYERDLVWRALKSLEAHAERQLLTRIRVTKRIPDGAGLGGGSSDAATTLVALRDLHAIQISDDALIGLAANLGADVTFFADPDELSSGSPPRPAFVSGIGELLERVDRINDPFTLVMPRVPCSTPDVYKQFDKMLDASHQIDEDSVRDRIRTGRLVVDASFNDLGAPARRMTPALDAIVRLIEPHTDVMMSGSGSSLILGSGAADLLPSSALSDVVLRRSRLV